MRQQIDALVKERLRMTLLSICDDQRRLF